jgi:hypothetical protein
MERLPMGAVLAFVALAAAVAPARAQSAPTPDSRMGPVADYLIPNRSDEIALARSAAPDSVAARAEVMVLGRKGYEIAVPGTNGFVCLVERSWDGAPRFWNPRVRSPDCFNAAAARFYVPIVRMKTRLALAGKSQAQITGAIEDALRQKRLGAPGIGAMSYMMSKQQYLNDAGKSWHPHVMFFVPLAMSKSWGANLPGSPVIASDDPVDGLTIFMIPVAAWSDGTPDVKAAH